MIKPIKLNGKSKYLLMPVDFFIGIISFYLGFFWRFDGEIPVQFIQSFQKLWFMYVLIKITVFLVMGIYTRVWKYAGTRDLVTLINSLILTNLGLVTAGYFIQIIVPRSVFIFTLMMDIFISGGIRVLPKIIKEKGLRIYNSKELIRLLVVGAGDAGVLVVRELFRQQKPTMLPVGFVDDDENKQQLKILGLPVLGKRDKLQQIINEFAIQEVLIAIPSAPGQVIKETFTICRANSIPVRTLPRMHDIINGQISVDLIREVKLEDLLGREPVQLDMEQITDSLRKKRVLVTGAGGSIGSELCRQIARCNPSEIILLGHDENPIFEIEIELKYKYKSFNIIPTMADVKDYERVSGIFKEYKPQVVFHAAAYKHVPLMEYNPGESYKNNVIGTKNVAIAADKYGAEAFVLISTDKAVNPSSVMGATKRIAEIIIQGMNEISNTRYTIVRFGNVLGSRGSVIPIFQEQIRAGGPVMVTHPEMKRYFMTIPEAVQLVLQAASMSEGGELFVLDMGEPVKIVDMARELIRLSGFEPDKDIAIQFTGIRPGEKLYEELLTGEEGHSATKHSRIYISSKQDFNIKEVNYILGKLTDNYNITRETVFNTLHTLENKRSNHKKTGIL